VHKFIDALLYRYSSTYMNRLNHYGYEYYAHYLRHASAWYGFALRGYYRYVAYHCVTAPMNIPSNGRILDIGCGVGLLVEQFCRLGYQAIGVEVNKAPIEHSLCPDQCFLAATTAELNYPDGYFDLIVSREVLEHIHGAEIDRCIREWDRVGKGAMVHIIAVSERGQSATQDPTHINVQPEAWWADKFQSYGYDRINPATKLLSPFGSSGYFRMSTKLSHGV